jgi:hypothetical protein
MLKLRPLVILLAASLACSCSKREEASVVAPVRGEPIRSSVSKSNDTSHLTKVVAATNAGDALKACDAPLPKRLAEKQFVEIGFDKLASYTFNVPDGVVPTNQIGKSEEQIPKEVKAFDQSNVALKGFMLPLKVDNGLVTEMLIMKDQSMCCYGSIPRINDWVSVKMKTGVKSIMDQPVTLYGKLRVGEMLENGYLVGIYELQGEKMDEPKN